MFGKNPILKSERKLPGTTLQVVQGSPFLTIQGEGPFIGRPAIFIRLHGCNLACWFCDTEFSNPEDPRRSIDDLASVALDLRSRVVGDSGDEVLVVITGGEPFRQNIVPLCWLLSGHGFPVQIETAGTLWLPNLPDAVSVVISPKVPKVNEHFYHRPNTYWKYVVSAAQQIDPHDGLPLMNTQVEEAKRPAILARPPTWLGRKHIFLSPMDEYDPERNKRNQELVAKLSIRHGYTAGVQLHKIFDVA